MHVHTFQDHSISKELMPPCKPFLRWAGGKNWLTKNIDPFLPSSGFNNYHEPFLGGGSVFFHLRPTGISYLSDLNDRLMDTYVQVKTNVELVVKHLKRFENSKECYYEVRDVRNFRSPASRAARFIFLNQTSFNGIYRENLNGKYNVPYGFRTKNFFEPGNLRLASENLKNSRICNRDFEECLDNVKRRDLVFLDPPYTITHNENGFFKYNKKLFNKKDQYRLSEMIDQIKRKDAFYILTNAAHAEVRDIFDKGDEIVEHQRPSLIGGLNAPRGKYSELIITNTSFSK